MDSHTFDQLQTTLQTAGADAAIEQLCARLEADKDFTGLFYALLMKKRHELGVSPVPTGANQDLPANLHAAFEDAIRDAGRRVGELHLQNRNLPGAWAYFRMLGEPQAVVAALDTLELRDDEDLGPLIDIAFHQGAHPRKGFDWILQRYGICSAITTLGSGEMPWGNDVRDYCVKKLLHSLHEELLARLRSEVQQKQGFEPTAKTIRELIQGRDWLFSDDFYHIDLSHLNAVVQMSIQLEPCPELQLARDLCAYGQKLSPKFLYQSDPPFEDQYRDYDLYLGVLTGEDVEGGLAHFRAKADAADPHEIGTYPAEVLVNLLLRIGRPQEAVAVARKHLAGAADRLSCPTIVELCQKLDDYTTLAEVAREQGNAVHFLAGLIGAKKK